MSEHSVGLAWERGGGDFSYESYSRDHMWNFDDTNKVCASAAAEYNGNPSCVDPEQAFVASLASCHMLTFLALACKRGFVVDSYADKAVGVLGRNDDRQMAIVAVRLKPVVTFGGEQVPDDETYQRMHHQAHRACFIANSVANCVKVELSPAIAG